MAEILGANIPFSFNLGFNSITWFLILLIVFVLAIGGVGFYLIHRFRYYNKRIIVFENIAGQGYQPVYKDRARLVRLGDGGEEILYLLKKKVYRTAYGKKMGKNTYWFAVGQDGYWYNMVLGDIDAKMGMLDIEPIDRDMRYMHVAIRKNIQDAYKKIGFMDKYGEKVFLGIFLIIMLIGMWFMLDKISDISSGMVGGIEASEELQQQNQKVLVALENIVSRFESLGIKGGSGLQPAT